MALNRRWTVAAVSAALAIVCATTGVEIWVRATWDLHRGTPDFYVPDAGRRQRLRENYSGWFAGVPVRINSLGLRDPREYSLTKGPTTFRILMLGDSVTFGHGSVYEHTYPYLLEQRLKKWRPEVDWQVWNAGVPGYNTSQELAQLLEVGPRFHPDLVVVGFYDNDVLDNTPVAIPSRTRRIIAAAEGFIRAHVWSVEFYRRVYYTVRWRLSEPDAYRRRIEELATADPHESTDTSHSPDQQLTPYQQLTDADLAAVPDCLRLKPGGDAERAVMRNPGYQPWLAAVREFQRLNRERQYRIVFFLNVVPRPCPGSDVFYAGGTERLNAFFLKTLGDGTPAASCHDAFLRTRPSQMPGADAHSIGNANAVKADVLFEFLKSRVLSAS